MLVSTEGLPGPVIVKRFGKPAMPSEIGLRTFAPLLLEHLATLAADVDP